MRTALLIGAFAGALALAAFPASADHWHGHGHDDWNVRVNVNTWRGGHWWHGPYRGAVSWWWVTGGNYYGFAGPVYPYPVYRPYPVYYYEPYPVYAAPVYSAPVYAAPPEPQYATPPAQSWYHCDSPKGYYPYVQDCRTGWRAVPATPPRD